MIPIFADAALRVKHALCSQAGPCGCGSLGVLAAMAIDVNPQQVRDTAELARIRLRDDEVAPLAAQLQKILGYVAELASLDTSQASPAGHVTGHVTVAACPLRADELAPSLPRDVVLSQAPRALDGAFVVPRFVEE